MRKIHIILLIIFNERYFNLFINTLKYLNKNRASLPKKPGLSDVIMFIDHHDLSATHRSSDIILSTNKCDCGHMNHINFDNCYECGRIIK